jgi:hypothetical protein
MAQIPWIDLAKVVTEAGFSATSAANALAIIRAESGRNPDAVNTVGNEPPSRDRGLWQINDHWHPEVTDECAFDPACSTAYAYKLSRGGTDFQPWVAYTNGAYLKHVEAAKVGLDGWQRVKALTGKLAACTDARTQLTNEAAQLRDFLTRTTTERDQARTELADMRIQVAALTLKIDAAKAALA